jgi:hypothetical protein
MARKRYQNGRVFLKGKKEEKWVGRYREDVVEITGTTRRVRRSVILGTMRELPTKRLAEGRTTTTPSCRRSHDPTNLRARRRRTVKQLKK